MKLDGNMDIIKEIPNIDIAFSIKNVNVTALNNFTNYYTGIDFESGGRII